MAQQDPEVALKFLFFFPFHLIEPDSDNQVCLGQCCNAFSDITLYDYITLYNDTTLSQSVTGL